MLQEFDKAERVHVNRDDRGIARELLHLDEPVVSEARTPQLAAAEYLQRYGPMLGIHPAETNRMALSPERDGPDTTSAGELRFQGEKHQFNTTTVAYQLTQYGLPVWHAGVAIHMKGAPYRVLSAQSTRHTDLDAKLPTQAKLDRLKKLDAATLKKRLGLDGDDGRYDPNTLKVEGVRLIIYRYEKARRVLVEKPPAEGAFGGSPPSLPLPPVDGSIQEGRHYVSAEVNFALAPRGHDVLHWVAIIEVETLSVLHLRAFVASANALVFQDDPMTTNGGPVPSAPSATLNPVRSAVLLQGLVASSPQPLTGNNVRLTDLELPTLAPPTEPSGADFNFDSRTNEFAAVNAYYHCDRFFRLVQSMGINLAAYFGPTVFPSQVDHRGSITTPTGVEINAHCVGTAGGLGIARTTFKLADLGDTVHPIGIACDYRVVLHELGGHGVLYPHVHSPNFGFAHSAGDSVAAITCDPDTHAPDRFMTFPWVNIGRRHDRTPAAGWGWAGNIALHTFDLGLDLGGYNNEQILSTTLFRFYRSIGGDSADLPTRQFAARYAVYLILRAIGSLTPMTNPTSAAGFATALMTADNDDWTTEGQAGGAYGKVIRWAFEKQGLYQPAGAPTPNNNEGAPPPVDVYIDDGRHGEYP